VAKISATCVTTFNKDIQLSLHQASPTPSCVCAGCFYRLRQLRRIRRSLDSDSLAALIYAVVNSRMDYCNTVLASAPTTVTDKLQRVLNAAARVITGTRKFDRGLGQILHWLDVPDRVLFKLAVTVHQCLNGRAPPYLSEHCIPVSNADTRRHLRSANRHYTCCTAFLAQHLRLFGVLGCWPDSLELSAGYYPGSNEQHRLFRRILKMYLFARY